MPNARTDLRTHADVFAALGDTTRLRLVTLLGAGRSLSIAELTEATTITRQAVTKHLRVLEHAHLVESSRHGREQRFKLHPETLQDARRSLDRISAQWDIALAKLKAFVE